ncbi:hypothetical protein D3C78_1713060 [compost metagenome]
MVTVILSPSLAGSVGSPEPGSSVTEVVSVVSFSVSCSNCSAPETLSSLLTIAGWPPVKMSSLAVTLAEPVVLLAGTVMVVPSLSLKVSSPWLLIGRPAALVRVTV